MIVVIDPAVGRIRLYGACVTLVALLVASLAVVGEVPIQRIHAILLGSLIGLIGIAFLGWSSCVVVDDETQTLSTRDRWFWATRERIVDISDAALIRVFPLRATSCVRVELVDGTWINAFVADREGAIAMGTDFAEAMNCPVDVSAMFDRGTDPTTR